MTATPRLPQTFLGWVCLFGPGAIIASLTIGTGELIFSTRGGALFGYHILFVFALTSVLKWGLVIGTSRHMILTGVHPYERMMDLPGPRGWLPILLLMISVVAMPTWVSFHSGVLGNLTAWVTGTSGWFHGGIDYVWGALILLAVLLLSATGGYTVLEKTQTAVVLAMVFCAGLTLVLYKPDWLQLLAGLLPHRMSYPDWALKTYPDITRHSVWVETTRYIGVIGGAGFDYLAYTSWLREKCWGVLPHKATPAQLEEVAADPNHVVRRWINAPIADCAISFFLVVAFSTVFVASGAMFLGPAHKVPTEENFLNLQSQFVTQIHPWLLPLYVIGAFLTMIGTLYGTVEIACSIADEIVRSFHGEWTPEKARRLRRTAIAWSTSVGFAILGWLFVRQATPAAGSAASASAGVQEKLTDAAARKTAATTRAGETSIVELLPGATEPPANKPKQLLKLMTWVNLFTGLFSCGLICMATLWMDRRWLPRALQPPASHVLLNFLSGAVFLALGVKGFYDNEDRLLVLRVLGGLVVVSLIASLLVRRPENAPLTLSDSTTGEPAS
jgi:Mn2+/Fe2+ NRAMP family transporter